MLMRLYCYGACRGSRVQIAVVWGGLSLVWHELEMLCYVYWTVRHLTSWINWTRLMSLYEIFYCSTLYESYYIHPQEPATVCNCIVLFWCVLLYLCGSAGVGWYPSAGWSTQHASNVITFILRSWWLYVGVLLCFGVYWCIGAVRLE